jgi:hypothetical protein
MNKLKVILTISGLLVLILAGFVLFGKEARAQSIYDQALRNMLGGTQPNQQIIIQPKAPVEYDHKGRVYHNPNLGLESLVDGYIARDNYIRDSRVSPELGRFWLERDIMRQGRSVYPVPNFGN